MKNSTTDTLTSSPYKSWKAWAALVVAFLSFLLLEDAIPQPWDVIAAAAVTSIGVWGVPNPLKNGGRRRAR